MAATINLNVIWPQQFHLLNVKNKKQKTKTIKKNLFSMKIRKGQTEEKKKEKNVDSSSALGFGIRNL